MAQASRMVRKLRKLKRERTIAMRMAKLALRQRDQARFIAGALEEQLKKAEDKVDIKVIEESESFGVLADQPEEASSE